MTKYAIISLTPNGSYYSGHLRVPEGDLLLSCSLRGGVCANWVLRLRPLNTKRLVDIARVRIIKQIQDKVFAVDLEWDHDEQQVAQALLADKVREEIPVWVMPFIDWSYRRNKNALETLRRTMPGTWRFIPGVTDGDVEHMAKVTYRPVELGPADFQPEVTVWTGRADPAGER